MLTQVLAEYRRGLMTVLLETVNGTYGKQFRVTYRQTFRSLDKAKSSVLTFIPPSDKQKVLDQIPKS